MIGLHLHNEHGRTDHDVFVQIIKFGILEVVSLIVFEKKVILNASSEHVLTHGNQL